ncbi:MAG TPA: rhodanese-like domain-containing protein [Armatimonadota bacterium]|nr:rhodanese-like domain-containing protein [Armatimonadota bacterium]
MEHQEPVVHEISRDELVHKMHSGDRFILVDVLSHEHFQRVHLPGAINVPLNPLRDLAPQLLGKQDQIIVYCANFDCTASPTAAKILTQLGFENVLDYAGGILDWEEGGMPVVRGQEPPQQRAA